MTNGGSEDYFIDMLRRAMRLGRVGTYALRAATIALVIGTIQAAQVVDHLLDTRDQGDGGFLGTGVFGFGEVGVLDWFTVPFTAAAAALITAAVLLGVGYGLRGLALIAEAVIHGIDLDDEADPDEQPPAGRAGLAD